MYTTTSGKKVITTTVAKKRDRYKLHKRWALTRAVMTISSYRYVTDDPGIVKE